MPTRVRFRFNKVTGEVEEFLVDDQDRQLPEAEHDRIAAEVGRFIDAHPRVREAALGAAPRAGAAPVEDRSSEEEAEAEGEGEATPERPEVG